MYEDYNQVSQGEIDGELSKFNWGAFFLGVIWAIPNGAWKDFWPTFLIMVILGLLTNIPLFGIVFAILILLLSIYIGRHGNEWAWYGYKKWKSLEEFTNVQKTWGAVSPFAWLALVYIVPVIIGMLTFIVVSPYAREIVNESDAVSKLAVTTIVSAPNYKDFQSGKDVAEYFVSKNIYKRYYSVDGNAVLAGQKGPYKAVLFFEKSEGRCTLQEKNCCVKYGVRTNDKLKPHSVTYFDDKGHTLSESLKD